MMFSGIDLIQKTSLLNDRAKVAESRASAPLQQEDSKNALLRFARFIKDQKKEQRKNPRPKKKHPYGHNGLLSQQSEKGQFINIAA